MITLLPSRIPSATLKRHDLIVKTTRGILFLFLMPVLRNATTTSCKVSLCKHEQTVIFSYAIINQRNSSKYSMIIIKHSNQFHLLTIANPKNSPRTRKHFRNDHLLLPKQKEQKDFTYCSPNCSLFCSSKRSSKCFTTRGTLYSSKRYQNVSRKGSLPVLHFVPQKGSLKTIIKMFPEKDHFLLH